MVAYYYSSINHIKDDDNIICKKCRFRLGRHYLISINGVNYDKCPDADFGNSESAITLFEPTSIYRSSICELRNHKGINIKK